MFNFDVKRFLDRCAQSSQQAYDGFRELLAVLEDPRTRVQARVFLTEIAKANDATETDEFLTQHHFSLEKLAIAQSEHDEETILQLLQLPSVFAPEEWSFTFFEGLTRYPQSEFFAKTVVEMGTGNGWISIALAKRSLPTFMLGLDINPRAVTCAKINLFLNALDDFGNEVFDSEGKTLLQRVDFAVSDLLEYCRINTIAPDRVIGCIPQVLDPDATLGDTLANETSSDQYLYSLSNYCGQQGYVEDQFGLGLIAKAVEEAATLCRPGYKLIFNLGGRPGSGVLTRLFERRGFSVERIWETRVLQASDTDISSLVEIEQNSPHRFEFFMGRTASESVSAKTAKAYQDAGGLIAHSLGVFEAQTNHHTAIKKILGTLKSPDFKDVRSGLDLAFQDKALGEEKISFLADLTERMNTEKWGYGETRGDVQLRRRIAEFLRSYFHIPLSAKNFLLTPNRQTCIRNLLWTFRPHLALVEKSFVSSLPKDWLGNDASVSVIETPSHVDLLCKLIETLQPQCVITKLESVDIQRTDALTRLVDICEQCGVLLNVDISDAFDLSSHPKTNGVFTFLSEQALKPHVTLFCGLVKNRVYPDLEVCFVLSENEATLEALESAAELTYSRVPLLNQFYYDRLFFRLLNFQLKSPRREKNARLNLRIPATPNGSFYKKFISPSLNAQTAFLSPAIRGNHLVLKETSLRLDYGENELPASNEVRLLILESFLRQNISPEEANPNEELSTLLKTRFGIERSVCDAFVYGGGVASLFAGIAQQAALENATLVFPHGCYGYFVAVAQFFGVKTVFVPTFESDRFKLTASELSKVLSEVNKPVVYLNAPTVNPTGAIYSQTEMNVLFETAGNVGARVVVDATFSGLEFELCNTNLQLSESIKRATNLEVCLLGSVSKELAAGGLRIGFGWTQSLWFRRSLQSYGAEPHFTMLYWLKRILNSINIQQTPLTEHLTAQRQLLSHRAQQLSEVLTDCGWHVLPPHGGLFLVAKPLQSFWDHMDNQTDWNDHTIVDLIFNKTEVLINSPFWTGLPGFCRFVLSVDERIFKDAIGRLLQCCHRS